MVAQTIARRSSCNRLQVGSVLVTLDNDLLFSGYNNALPGETNRCKRKEKGNCGCTHSERGMFNRFHEWSIKKYCQSYPEYKLYVTHLPCVSCAEAIVNNNIKEVYFINDYTYQESKQILKKAGIKLRKVSL